MGDDKPKILQNFDNPVCPLPIIRDAKTLFLLTSNTRFVLFVKYKLSFIKHWELTHHIENFFPNLPYNFQFLVSSTFPWYFLQTQALWKAATIFEISTIQYCGGSVFFSSDEISLSLDEESWVIFVWLVDKFCLFVASSLLWLIFAMLFTFFSLRLAGEFKAGFFLGRFFAAAKGLLRKLVLINKFQLLRNSRNILLMSYVQWLLLSTTR